MEKREKKGRSIRTNGEEEVKVEFEKIKAPFSVLSPAEMRKLSVVELSEIIELDAAGLPVRVRRVPKLGPLDESSVCETCGKGIDKCPGHFGHIDLVRPVVNGLYAEIVLDLLRHVCQNCGRPLLKGRKDWGDVMFSELAGPEKKCPHCGKDQQEITYSYPFFMEGEKWLTPTEVKARLERIGSIGIPREGGKWGFMRPEGMVLEVVLVHRDFLKETGGARTIANIIHTNIRLEQNLGAAPEFLIEDLWGLLHSWVDTYLMTLFNRYLLYLRGKLHEESRKIVKDFFFHTCLYLEPDLKI